MYWRSVTVCALVGLGCGRGSAPGDESARQTDVEVSAPAVAVAGDRQAENTPEPEAKPSIERPAFDLIDNRHLAHRVRADALVLDPGSPGFGKYMRVLFAGLEWELGATQDGVPVARPTREAVVRVPLDAAQVNAVSTVHIRVYTPEKRRLRVAVNHRIKHKSTLSIALKPGWQTVAVPLKTGDLRVGVNEIRTRHTRRAPLSVAWIQVGGEPMPERLTPLSPPQQPASDSASDSDSASAGRLTLSRGEGLLYHVFVPPRSHLVADVVGEGCSVEVSAADHEGAQLQGSLPGRVALGGLADRVVRLRLRADGCERAQLTRAAIVVPGEVVPVHTAPPPRYIVLWVMDTLRADKMRTVNPDARAEIPNLTRLAETGAAFRQYYVQGNESQTSHASVWTSMFPANHGVITSGPLTRYTLSKRFERIGPLMKTAGMRTVGVTANGTIIPWSGYTRGFDVFNNIMRDGTGKRLGHRVPGDLVFDRTMEKVGDDVSDPMFLFIGTTDTHKPWFGHQPWLDRYDTEPYSGRFKTSVQSTQLGIPKGTHLCGWKVPEREMQRIHAIYDSSISFQDAQLGRLLDRLDEWGIRDQTMLVVTADHGEELWEHPRRCGHGSSLRQTLVHVPLLIHYPPLIPQTVVDTGVDGVDILPTLLDALGRPPLDSAQGASLIPLTQGRDRDYPRPSYASMNELSHTMRLRRWKAIVNRRGVTTMHDVRADPFERTDISDARPIERQWLSDAMTMFLLHRKEWKKSAWGVSSNMSPHAAAALERDLR